VNFNHELVEKAMLPKEINMIIYQGRCKEKGVQIKVTLR